MLLKRTYRRATDSPAYWAFRVIDTPHCRAYNLFAWIAASNSIPLHIFDSTLVNRQHFNKTPPFIPAVTSKAI
jgi:hypothetical protein